MRAVFSLNHPPYSKDYRYKAATLLRQREFRSAQSLCDSLTTWAWEGAT
jgi:hypothetical protein